MSHLIVSAELTQICIILKVCFGKGNKTIFNIILEVLSQHNLTNNKRDASVERAAIFHVRYDYLSLENQSKTIRTNTLSEAASYETRIPKTAVSAAPPISTSQMTE